MRVPPVKNALPAETSANHLLPPPAARMTRADHRGCSRYHPTTSRGTPTLPRLKYLPPQRATPGLTRLGEASGQGCAAAASATIRLHPAATTLPRLKYLPLPRATPGLTCQGKPPGKAALLLLLLPPDYIPRHRRCRASSTEED